MGAGDLDGESLSKAFRVFIERVAQAGPNAVAAVYFSGYGLQIEGENLSDTNRRGYYQRFRGGPSGLAPVRPDTCARGTSSKDDLRDT